MPCAATPPRTGSSILKVAVFLPPLLSFGALAWHARTVVDDAFINFRIVENLLNGFGPVYNVGERVEAATSPAWVIVLGLLGAALSPFGVSLPWVSVGAGIAAGVGGLALAQLTTARLWAHVRDVDVRWPALMVPAGAWIIVALPPFWEFIASGLETGLTLLWIGASAWVVATAEARSWRGWRALVIGVGLLVRPELGLIALPFGTALWWLGPRTWRAAAGLGAWGGALPCLVQVFRMGFYAALVPNTALAKEAFEPYWGRGFAYLQDFIAPYGLLVLLMPVIVMTLRMTQRSAPSTARSVAVAALAGGVLHALYVVRLGGDFMHGRLLLPALFTLALPASMWPIRPRRRGAAFSFVAQTLLLLGLAGWAGISAAFLRVDYQGEIGSGGIADEVGFYRSRSGLPNPVEPGDFRALGFVDTAEGLRRRALGGDRVLMVDDVAWPLDPGVPAAVVTDAGMLGVTAYIAGPRVQFLDAYGLADPIASRLELTGRARAGHDKQRLPDWLVGRFVAETALAEAGRRYPAAADARAALACGPLRELVAAVTAPMTPKRFLGNLAMASRLTALRIPPQPADARLRFCGS